MMTQNIIRCNLNAGVFRTPSSNYDGLLLRKNTPSWMTEGVLNMLLLKNIAGVTCPKVTLDAAK